MSPVKVNANSNHGTPTVAPVTATMNGSTQRNSIPKASSQNRINSAKSNITSHANPSPTRRFSLPTIRLAGWNKSFSLQQSFKRQRRNSNEDTNQGEPNHEEIIFSERFTLNLPPWISADKSEIDYIRRTQMEEFLRTAGESMLSRLPPLGDEEDEQELNLHADWVDPTLDTGDVKLVQNNTKNTATTPIIPEKEEATSNTQQQTTSGSLRDSSTATSKYQDIYEANEILIMIACFQQSTEINSESPSNNNNNHLASRSRVINMSRGQSQPLSYYRQPRRRE